MKKKLSVAVAGAAVALAAFAPAAMASGGLDSGGSGGGGGGGGGGTTVTTTAPAPTSCATITGFSNTTGYYSVFAAIWTKFSFSSTCSTQVTMRMTYLNGNTGNVDFSASTPINTGTIDEDWGAFNTPYTVTISLTDSSGAVLASQTAVITTKPPKTAGA